jgi:ribosome-binding ATPase YchF (GTP1/OBG family)
MRVALTGFAGSGKTTLFRWLTGVQPDTAAGVRGQLGVARLHDERLQWLAAQAHSRKVTPATLEFLDVPGLVSEDTRDNARRLATLREADALLLVLATFREEPLAEYRRLQAELTLADLEIVSNRLQRLEALSRKGRCAAEREADERERGLLLRLQQALEQQSQVTLTPEESKLVRAFQLFSLKPQMVLLNTSESLPESRLPVELLRLNPPPLAVPVQLEWELSQLPEAERESFARELGLERLGPDEVLRRIFYGLGQIVFFTMNEEECRAWPIRAGTPVVQAAGTIHSDFEAGFIRAEVIPFAELRKSGSLKEAKAHGLVRLEGKTYAVQDGDVIYILAHR